MLPWLYQHRTNVTSQTGEDGVIAAIFERLGAQAKICVDIGAADGYFISNSWHWLNDHGWSGVLIEGDADRYKYLKDRYADRDDVHCLNEFVTPGNGIDHFLAKCGMPKTIDLLSIDIDGMDYHVWRAMEAYTARVVVIEVNCTMAPDIHFVQNDPALNFGSSARAMIELARTKGYQLVAHLVSNCIFVRNEDFQKMEIADNTLETLFTSPFVPRVISDINGVHYILKEGAWGFNGAINIGSSRIRENGVPHARRAILKADKTGHIPANEARALDCEASVVCTEDTIDVLQHFVDRMEVAFTEREKMWAAAEKKRKK
jgi:hypothetical protein